MTNKVRIITLIDNNDLWHLDKATCHETGELFPDLIDRLTSRNARDV